MAIAKWIGAIMMVLLKMENGFNQLDAYENIYIYIELKSLKTNKKKKTKNW